MKKSKIFSIIALTIILLLIASNLAFAVDPKQYTGDTNNTSGIKSVGQQIIGIVQVVGSLTAVVMLIVLGIKYMMGSTEEKAEYKKTLLPYVIGAILIFAASNLAGMIYSWANSITVK